MKNIIRAVAVTGVSACLAVIGLVGCAQEQAPEEEPIVEEQPAYELIIGAEDEEVVHLPITNGTEQTIIGLQLKPVDATEFSENIMTAGQTWEPAQEAEVFFEGIAAEEAEAELKDEKQQNALIEASETEEPLLLNEVYDVQLTTTDGAGIVLHQLSLTGLVGMEDITVEYDAISGFGYLTYLDDGTEVSTLESEQHMSDAAAAVAQAEAEAQAAAEAEAEAAAQAARQSQSSQYSGGGYSSGGYDSVSSGSGGGSSAPSQTEDACINPDDLALN